MEWKPKRWIAVLLSVLNAPLGLLYVERWRLALAYLVISLTLQIAGFTTLWLQITPPKWGMAMLAIGWVINIIAAVHAFRISSAVAPSGTREWYSRWYGLIGLFVAFNVVALLFRSFLYEPFRIPSEAMYPTLSEGSFVLVKKLGYGDYGSLNWTIHKAAPTAVLSRGELILFRLPEQPETVYLKRVIGLPGDRIECRASQLVINGKPVPIAAAGEDAEYQYVNETFDGVGVTATVAHLRRIPGRDCDDVVPPDHYFMLGDNRANSRDSRYFGMVPRTSLVGRVALPPQSQ